MDVVFLCLRHHDTSSKKNAQVNNISTAEYGKVGFIAMEMSKVMKCPTCENEVEFLNSSCKKCGKSYTHCKQCGDNFRETKPISDLGLNGDQLFGPVTFCDGCTNAY
jgi:predicted RNA-binding Zn-ribbon protein involved in translation (DUF1610 family)